MCVCVCVCVCTCVSCFIVYCLYFSSEHYPIFFLFYVPFTLVPPPLVCGANSNKLTFRACDQHPPTPVRNLTHTQTHTYTHINALRQHKQAIAGSGWLYERQGDVLKHGRLLCSVQSAVEEFPRPRSPRWLLCMTANTVTATICSSMNKNELCKVALCLLISFFLARNLLFLFPFLSPLSPTCITTFVKTKLCHSPLLFCVLSCWPCAPANYTKPRVLDLISSLFGDSKLKLYSWTSTAEVFKLVHMAANCMDVLYIWIWLFQEL